MQNDDKFVIYGCGGHARSIINAIHRKEKEKEIILVDDNAMPEEKIMGCSVIKHYQLTGQEKLIVAIGNNKIRKMKYEEICNMNHFKNCFTNVISETAVVSAGVRMGNGIFIGENAFVGPEAVVGNDSIINTGSIVEHETNIGAHVHIAPNATVCGRCRIGNGVLIGAGSTIIDNISIADNTIIGAGTVVINNILISGTYVGIPAKKCGGNYDEQIYEV